MTEGLQTKRQSPCWYSGWRTLTHLLFWLLLATVLAAFGSTLWALELLTHFRPHYVLLSLPLFITFLLGRRWLQAVLSGTVLAINTVLVAPLFVPQPTKNNPNGPELTVVSFNVNTSNADYEAAIDYLRDSDADVMLVLEVNRAWIGHLESLGDGYRMIARPRSDNFGIALLSRLPVRSEEVLDLSGLGVPSVSAVLEWEEGPLALLGTHPVPPVSAEATEDRDRQLEAIARWVNDQSTPTVVLGDLNTTRWSRPFQKLMEDGGLRDSALGFGLGATWPSFLGPFGIAIDHCLTTSHFVAIDRRIGPQLGSDHLPLEIVLGVREAGR